MITLLCLVIAFFTSLFLSLFSLPYIAKTMIKYGVVGEDKNKKGNIILPEMCGVSVVIGFFFSILFFIFLTRFIFHEVLIASRFLLFGLLATMGSALVGSLDDMFDLKKRYKALLPFLFAIPLGLYIPGTILSIPFIGDVDFGLFMFILIPLGVTSAANAVNMLEGFNGLSSGLGALIVSTLIAISIIRGSIIPLIILLPLLGALLPFFFYNRYPATVFPGDIFTLFLGASLAVGAIIGGLKEIGAILLLPMIVEFFLKARGKFKAQNFGKIDDEGYLHFNGRIESITHFLMKSRKLRERDIVMIIFTIEAIICSFVLLLVVTGLY
ncbi:MAG: hypothetical protein AB1779_06975 [Candidatus Thermoplasmatota archaeon]